MVYHYTQIIFGETTVELASKTDRHVEHYEIPVPPNMNTDNYKAMNLIPGQRIGHFEKQEYLDKLTDLYAEGYLTKQEWEQRIEWVNDAQTKEQLEIAFTDLKNVLSAMKVEKFKNSDREIIRRKEALIIPVFLIVVFINGIVGDAVSRHWFAVSILSVLLIITIRAIIKGFR